MKQNITFSAFTDGFRDCRPDNFSYQGLRVLYDYLTQLEEDCDFEIEFDVIAICCDFSEEDTKCVLANYDLESLDELRHNTTVIEIDDETIIYQVY